MRGICESFGGPDYHRRIVEADEPPTELWNALAEKGYLGVNLPERYGGGGLGMHALQMVGEEISAAGCSLLLIVVSPAIVGSILARHGTEAQRERMAARDRRRARPRSRSRSPSPTPARTRTTSRRAATRDGDVYRLRGTKTYISGRRGRRRDPRDRAQARGRRHARPAAADAGRRRLRRAREAGHPGRREGLRQAVDAVLRRRRGARRPGRGRVRDRGPEGRVRRAQPRADHGRLGLQRRRRAGRSRSPRRTPTSASSGRRRSAPTRASRTRSRRRRSSSSSPG